MIRDQFENGLVVFADAQIPDYTQTKYTEAIRCKGELIPLEIGKKASRVRDPVNIYTPVENKRQGEYFLWWSKPLINYYHIILDGLGCLWYYLDLRKSNPDIILLLNRTPRPGVAKYPPFVIELLELFDINWEYTDPSAQYETVYFGDTLNQDETGGRVAPDPKQWTLIEHMVRRSCEITNTPTYNKIYVSRRAHANPLNNRKDVIGEDNTVKRGLTNEDEVVKILTDLGYTEVFGENYTLAEKIALFSKMHKYISTAGAGVTNMLWVRDHEVRVGGVHTPGFPFPSNNHNRHICCQRPYSMAQIDCYKGAVLFHDPEAGEKNYNNPWYINNLKAFRKWAETI